MTDLQNGFEAQARSLREFGYPDVTAAKVEAAHGRWKGGEEAADIIDKFCFGAFGDYPTIFGTRE